MTYKFSVISLLFCISFAQAYQFDISNNKQIARKHAKYLHCLTQEINPQTTIMVFDLHEVLLDRSKIQIAFSCVKLLPRGMWWYLFNYRFWRELNRLCSQVYVEEAIFNELTKKYPDLNRFRQNFFDIANNVTINQMMANLIVSLKNKGYKIYILSNIGQEIYKQLYPKYANFFDQFDGAYMPGIGNNYSHKPQVKFYQEFKNYLSLNGNEGKQILFIDDIEQNIEGAFAQGIAGIHCICQKHVINMFKKLSII